MPTLRHSGSRALPLFRRLKRLAMPVAALALATTPLLAASTATAGRVQLVKSPGGIEAWLVESHDVPLIDMSILFKGGDLQDRPGKAGTALITGYMFNEGGGDLNPEQFIAARDEIGASIGAEASSESVQVTFQTVSEHRDRAFELLALAFNAPRNEQGSFDRGLRELSGSQESALTDPVRSPA